MTADAVGGVWTYALTLARQLSERGIQTMLATMGPRPSPEQRGDALAIRDTELVESDYALEWEDEPWAGVDRAGDWLLELERRFDPDVVHLNGYSHAAFGFRAPTVVVAHSCVCSWWRAVHGEPAPARYGTYRRRVAEGLSAASAVVAPTFGMARRLHDEYGGQGLPLVIPNGSALRLRPPAKRPVVLASGRLWDAAKNVASLAACAGHVDWPIRIAGSESGPPGGAASLSLTGVRLLGALSPAAMAREMAEAAVFAHPARYEPFGLAPLEAALSGCALLLGDIDSLREVWADAALYVPPDDVSGLTAALRRLVRDEALRAVLAGRARERAQRFSATRMADGYVALYTRLGRASAPAPSGD